MAALLDSGGGQNARSCYCAAGFSFGRHSAPACARIRPCHPNLNRACAHWSCNAPAATGPGLPRGDRRPGSTRAARATFACQRFRDRHLAAPARPAGSPRRSPRLRRRGSRRNARPSGQASCGAGARPNRPGWSGATCTDSTRSRTPWPAAAGSPSRRSPSRWKRCRARCGRGTARLRDAAGKPQSLVVFGLGKLGGGELNFSSDIDLIYAFAEHGDQRWPAAAGCGELFHPRRPAPGAVARRSHRRWILPSRRPATAPVRRLRADWR